jgi:hypothetical protein
LKAEENNLSRYAYGLGIRSSIELPELVRDEERSDVEIHTCDDYYAPEPARGREWHYEANGDKAFLFNRGVGLFMIRQGKEIIVNPAPGADELTIRLFIIGVVMTVVLHQREQLVLHANCVRMNDSAIAFIGARGCGKSSITAALYSRGHSIVADDITPVLQKDGRAAVYPGFPQLKITEDVALSLGYDRKSLIPLAPFSPKFGLRVARGFCKEPVQLKHVYLLTRGSALEIRSIKPQETFLELLRNSVFSGGASHFLKCTSLSEKVGFSRISHPYSLSALPHLAQMVEEHALTLK